MKEKQQDVPFVAFTCYFTYQRHY